MINSSGFFGSPAPLPEQDGAGLEILHSSQSGPCVLLKGHRNDRLVVYKCLKSEFRNDPVQQRMLRREYEIGASLTHPGICEVLDWVVLPGYGDAIEMEWVDGAPLGEWLSRHEGDVQLVSKVLRDICDALSYIHHKQVIHKDLKPENILITRFGDYVKILDFGLSDTNSILTGKGPAGTPRYAAPEVLDGQSADALSDIYSLGRIIESCGPAFKHIAKKCSATDRRRRYASSEEVRDALESVSGKKSLLPPLAAALVLLGALAAWFFLLREDPVEKIFTDAVEQVRDASATPR